MGREHSTRELVRAGAPGERSGSPRNRRPASQQAGSGGQGAKVLHLRATRPDPAAAPDDAPNGDVLTLLSTVVSHPGSSLDALRLRARLTPAAFASAVGALSASGLISLRARTRVDDGRAKAYPNPSGREALAAAKKRKAERPVGGDAAAGAGAGGEDLEVGSP